MKSVIPMLDRDVVKIIPGITFYVATAFRLIYSKIPILRPPFGLPKGVFLVR